MTAMEIAERFTDPASPFEEMARTAFESQRETSPIYSRYAGDHHWTGWDSAPYLPVEAFKWSGIVDLASARPEMVFASSGTGGSRSRHPVVDLAIYEKSVVTHFGDVFGDGSFALIANLPTYERKDDPSSLLYMVDVLMQRFGTPASGWVADRSQLEERIRRVDDGSRILIFGTAFGLLDMVEEGLLRVPATTLVIETGGMKTFRREINRTELHGRLAEGFGLQRNCIRSEYGMCELLSQCYTRGGDLFYAPSWMRFRVVDVEEPEREVEAGYPGLLALFDLANIHSVSAVLTSDLAIARAGGFELLGRADAAEIRGCNFLMRPNP